MPTALLVQESVVQQETFPLTLHLRPALDWSDAQFFAFCRQNDELRIEQTAGGDVIIMPPTGFETGYRNNEMSAQLRDWARQDGTGVAVDSSTGFVLPNGAKRSPDAAWILRSRLAPLTPEQKRQLLPLCPDFVVELRSPSDSLRPIQEKMQEYIDNGARLGWLLDTPTRSVHVYRLGRDVTILADASSVSADPELPGFTLDLRPIWNPDF